jgi:hypothetical protein
LPETDRRRNAADQFWRGFSTNVLKTPRIGRFSGDYAERPRIGFMEPGFA